MKSAYCKFDFISAGELPIYAKPPDTTAYLLGEKGESILAVEKPRRVIFPLWELKGHMLGDPDEAGLKKLLRQHLASVRERTGVLRDTYYDLEGEDAPTPWMVVAVKKAPTVFANPSTPGMSLCTQVGIGVLRHASEPLDSMEAFPFEQDFTDERWKDLLDNYLAEQGPLGVEAAVTRFVQRGFFGYPLG